MKHLAKLLLLLGFLLPGRVWGQLGDVGPRPSKTKAAKQAVRQPVGSSSSGRSHGFPGQHPIGLRSVTDTSVGHSASRNSTGLVNKTLVLKTVDSTAGLTGLEEQLDALTIGADKRVTLRLRADSGMALQYRLLRDEKGYSVFELVGSTAQDTSRGRRAYLYLARSGDRIAGHFFDAASPGVLQRLGSFSPADCSMEFLTVSCCKNHGSHCCAKLQEMKDSSTKHGCIW